MQSKFESLVESVVNILIGLWVSMLANWLILPVVFNVTVSLVQNLQLGFFYTAVSLIRSYMIRRYFNKNIGKFSHAISGLVRKTNHG